MSERHITVSTLNGETAVETLADLRQVLLSALLPNSSVRLAAEILHADDPRSVQLIEAARQYANGVGADFGLTAPAGPGIVAMLDRVGVTLTSDREKSFWLQEKIGS